MNQLRKISAKYLLEETKKSFQQYEKAEQESILYLLFAEVFNIPKIDFLSDKIIGWNAAQQEQLESCLARLNNHEPVQYIIGKTFFYDSYFNVTKHTLIPRPETEELVQLIVSDASQHTPNIIDIGTGSGCIAVSLAKAIPKASVSAVDISAEALSIARANALLNGVNVSFIELDFLKDKEQIPGRFDIIVSNPPYVLESEKPEMRNNVLEHEPHLALFVEDNHALKYYEELLDFATTHLVEDGFVYAEINEQKGAEMVALAAAYGLSDAVIIKDMFQKDRIFKAQKKQRLNNF